MTTPDVIDPTAKRTRDSDIVVADIRSLLTQAVIGARQRLAEAEDDYRRVQDELELVRSSAGRRWLLRLRGRAVALAALVAFPWHALQAVPVLFSNVTARWRRLETLALLRYRSIPVRHLPPIAQETTHTASIDAIRWIGPTVVAGRSLHALFCHPDSSVTVRVAEASGATLVAWAALMPAMWPANPDGVEFVLTARCEDGSWRGEVRRHVHPRLRIGDRRWRRLRLPLPRTLTAPVVVTLATRLRPGASPDSAWAIWGEPTLRWPRGLLDLGRLARTTLRQLGVRGTLAKLQDQAGHDEERARFRRWLELNTPSADRLREMEAEARAFAYQPLVSIITPVFNTEPRWLTACVESVRRQVYPNWELCLADDASTSAATVRTLERYKADPRIKIVRLERNQHICGASNAALAQASGEFVAMLDHDDELPPEALFEVVKHLNANPDVDFVYSDEDKLEANRTRSDPYFKPDWSPDLFRTFNYTNHFMVLRRSVVAEVGGFRVGFEGSQDYDLVLRIVERTGKIAHIPKILYHWRKIAGSAAAETQAKPWAIEAGRRALADHLRRRGIEGDVGPGLLPGLFRVRYAISGNPLVTIIVTTDDRTREINGREVRLLTNCLRSVVQKTHGANYEILVVDNGRLSDESAAFLSKVPHRRASFLYSGPFNFARKLRFAVGHARGEHLVLFNDDLEVMTSEWLSAMLEFSQQKEVGAVGAKLFFPDGRLQHIGLVLGVAGVAAHAFHMAPGSTPGYAGSAHTIRNCSCVTAACLMTRREVFEEVGGFDEKFPLDFGDVDYCLRLRRAGYRIVYTPYAQLYHLESGSLGRHEQSRSDLDEMRRIWGRAVEDDPYYNLNLTRDFSDHRIGV
jgi:GT2 family glycosyltransferase